MKEKDKYQLVSNCWNCQQVTKTRFETYHSEFVDSLKKENARLREALEKIAKDTTVHDGFSSLLANRTANDALKEANNINNKEDYDHFSYLP